MLTLKFQRHSVKTSCPDIQKQLMVGLSNLWQWLSDSRHSLLTYGNHSATHAIPLVTRAAQVTDQLRVAEELAQAAE